jgi:hypothetical protein
MCHPEWSEAEWRDLLFHCLRQIVMRGECSHKHPPLFVPETSGQKLPTPRTSITPHLTHPHLTIRTAPSALILVHFHVLDFFCIQNDKTRAIPDLHHVKKPSNYHVFAAKNHDLTIRYHPLLD